ncbi:MAG: nucleotide exchange factor GrpE, partial [Acidimicrobiales bacterium]
GSGGAGSGGAGSGAGDGSGDSGSSGDAGSRAPKGPGDSGDAEAGEVAEAEPLANDLGAEPFKLGGFEGLAGLEGLDDVIADEVARVAAERDEYLDALKRLQADFDNFRKRTVRQQTELLERAAEGLLNQLLPVLDALDLAMVHREGAGELDGVDADAKSLDQIGGLLRATLEREGLERIDAVAVPFDPTIHDAVAHEEASFESGGGEDGGDTEIGSEGGGETGPTIAEILRAGYRLKGRVIRPAMVKVRG